ncbi:MAG: hypothetical protein ACYSWU_15000, partial [Planctomycetota bacterium]
DSPPRLRGIPTEKLPNLRGKRQFLALRKKPKKTEEIGICPKIQGGNTGNGPGHASPPTLCEIEHFKSRFPAE